MQQLQAIAVFSQQDHLGRYVYTSYDIAKLFPEDKPRTLKAGLQRLVSSGILIRAVKGVYVFNYSKHKGADTLEQVAKTMRRGEYSYVSLESALSEYGVISQIPLDRITVMTSGGKGEYKTPFGVIEFTHTNRPVRELINSMVNVGRPLRLARKHAALRDLKRVGRNMHLVDMEAMHED